MPWRALSLCLVPLAVVAMTPWRRPGKGGGRLDRAGMRELAAWLGRLATICAAFGLALALVRGDRWRLTAPFAFAIPPTMAAVLLAAAALCWLAARHRRRAIAAAAGALATGLVALAMDWRSAECRPRPPGATRVATWNVGRAWSAERAARLASLDADLVALIEAGEVAPERWTAALPGHHLCAPGSGIVVLSRHPLRSCERHVLPGASRAVLAVLDGGAEGRILAVDVAGDLLAPRRRAIAAIAELAGRSADTIVLGDFNTPRRAWGFDPLRVTHANAFSLSGSGWAGTWPAPAPLLELDQVWLPRGSAALCARVLPPAGGDHRPLVVDLPPTGSRRGAAATAVSLAAFLQPASASARGGEQCKAG